MQSPSLRFSESVRVLADAGRRSGLAIPVFRTPPRRPDVDRAIRRGSDGSCVVAIRVTGRPFAAVQADLVDALVVVNGLDTTSAGVRRELWNALVHAGQVEGPASLAAA